MSEKNKFIKKQINIVDLRDGMIFAGFFGVPSNFHPLGEKHILFLQKYNLKDIKLIRDKREYTIDAHELKINDHILHLGRLEKFLKISNIDRTKHYLSMYGFNQIYILERKQIPTEKTVPPPTSQAKQKQTAKDNLYSMQENMQKSEYVKERGASIIQDIFRSGNFQNFKLETIEEVAKDIDSSLNNNPSSYNVLTLLKDHDEYTFRHCVDVANQMLMTLKFMRYDTIYDMKEIGAAAMLHDIGKSKIPPEILNKPGKLSDQEWVYMKMHPVYSAEIMKGMGMSTIQVGIGYKHHVKKNNTGYPPDVKYEDTTEVERLCTISDVFQALITKRPYKMTDTPIQAFKKLKQWMTTDFDETLVEVFIKAFGIFPPGSMVKLSDGRCAFVVVRGKDALRPIIAVVVDVDQSVIQRPELIDLESSEYVDLRILEGTNHRNYFSENEAYEIFQKLA